MQCLPALRGPVLDLRRCTCRRGEQPRPAKGFVPTNVSADEAG